MTLGWNGTLSFLGDEWTPVDSEPISAARYDGEHELLYLRFRKSGKEYQYWGVPFEKAYEFAQAASHGTWLWDNLKVRGEGPERSQYPFVNWN